MKLIIDIPEEVYKNIMNDHGVSPYGMVFNSIQNGTPIPDNATNDVLEQIRAEILNFKEKCNASDYLGCGILKIIDKYIG